MQAQQLRLDDQLCFLFHRIGRELNAVYRPLLADLGITYPQYLVLLVLWESEGLGLGELGDRLCLDSATLSPLVQRMERAGLVRRLRQESDERRVAVQLTDRGRRMEAQATAIPQALAGRLVDSEEEYRALKSLLLGLAERIPSAGGGT